MTHLKGSYQHPLDHGSVVTGGVGVEMVAFEGRSVTWGREKRVDRPRRPQPHDWDTSTQQVLALGLLWLVLIADYGLLLRHFKYTLLTGHESLSLFFLSPLSLSLPPTLAFPRSHATPPRSLVPPNAALVASPSLSALLCSVALATV